MNLTVSVSTQGYIEALRKAHMCSAPSLISLLIVAFKMAQMLVQLNAAFLSFQVGTSDNSLLHSSFLWCILCTHSHLSTDSKLCKSLENGIVVENFFLPVQRQIVESNLSSTSCMVGLGFFFNSLKHTQFKALTVTHFTGKYKNEIKYAAG